MKNFYRKLKLFPVALLTTLLAFACNFPQSRQPSTESQPITNTVQVQPILQATENWTSTTQAIQATQAPVETPTFTLTPTPQKPAVRNDTLCWVGPGVIYEVVSALKKGEPVEIIGRGSVPGWFIIRNPIYHDPCWVQTKDLQVDPSLDVNSLKIYSPPPTDTPTHVPSPTPP